MISSCNLCGGIPDSRNAVVTMLTRLRLLSCAGERLTATLMCSGQLTASSQAALRTHSPSGTINPVSSAIGMKSAGDTSPRAG